MTLTPLQEEAIEYCIEHVRSTMTGEPLKDLYGAAVIDGMELLRDALRSLDAAVPS